MARAQNDRPGPGQQSSIEIVEAVRALVARGDSISIGRMPGRRGVSGNETAGRFCLFVILYLSRYTRSKGP